MDLEARKIEIERRLTSYGSLFGKNSNEQFFIENPKLETHWDCVLKEVVRMLYISCHVVHSYIIDFLLFIQAWLANDFSAERLRHKANAKKVTKSVDLYHKTKEVKKAKKQKEELAQLKRLANKHARDIENRIMNRGSPNLARGPSFHEKTEAAINAQISVELRNSYSYLSMWAYFDRDDVGLKNVARFDWPIYDMLICCNVYL